MVVKVLFVCLGNICRSPTAEGVFRQKVADQGLGAKVKTDSAGTSAWHVGAAPDPRAQAAAAKRGYDLSDLRGRQAKGRDFMDFDYVIAMDRSNYTNLQSICPAGFEDRLYMFLDFASDYSEEEVPDPYYGGVDGFDHVLDLIEAASEGLIKDIRHHFFP